MKKAATVEICDGYRLIRSDRKTLSLEVGRDGSVTVRAPRRTGKEFIEGFVRKHSAWIAEKQKTAKDRAEKSIPSDEKIAELTAFAKLKIPERVAYWSQITGLSASGIKITRARTRWGSCSPKNSLCFSCYLAERSEEEIDYVVLHELAHTVEKNHGENFYRIIGRYMPDYKNRVKSLKQ